MFFDEAVSDRIALSHFVYELIIERDKRHAHHFADDGCVLFFGDCFFVHEDSAGENAFAFAEFQIFIRVGFFNYLFICKNV